MFVVSKMFFLYIITFLNISHIDWIAARSKIRFYEKKTFFYKKKISFIKEFYHIYMMILIHKIKFNHLQQNKSNKKKY